jgi:hypothetical protein
LVKAPSHIVPISLLSHARARSNATVATSFVVLFAFASSTGAQSSAFGMWTTYSGDHAIAQRLAVTADAQLRLGGQEPVLRNVLLRPGMSFALNDRVRLGAGYALSHQDPSDAALPTELEHRIWQTVQLSHRARNAQISHRFRLEQRFHGERESHSAPRTWSSSGRARYSLRSTVPLSSSGRSWISVGDEMFLGFGGSAGAPAFDQNRAHLAFGTRLAPALRVEAGYLYQTTRTDADRLTAGTHILLLSLQSSMPVRSQRRTR